MLLNNNMNTFHLSKTMYKLHQLTLLTGTNIPDCGDFVYLD